MLISQIVNGLVIGSGYAIVAVGLTLVFMIFKIPWFVQAILVVYGAYFTYFALGLNIGFIGAVTLSVLGCILLAVLIERLFIRYAMSLKHEQLLIGIFAVLTILKTIALTEWGGYPKYIPSFAPTVIKIGEITITLDRIIMSILSIVIIGLLALFLKRAKLGKAIRATSQDYRTASILGININKISVITFIITGALAAIGGSMLGMIYYVHPKLADLLIMKTFIALILGGFGNIFGALVGSYVVGLTDSLGIAYLGAGMKEILLFIVILVILLIKPSGLFSVGRRK